MFVCRYGVDFTCTYFDGRCVYTCSMWVLLKILFRTCVCYNHVLKLFLVRMHGPMGYVYNNVLWIANIPCEIDGKFPLYDYDS